MVNVLIVNAADSKRVDNKATLCQVIWADYGNCSWKTLI